MFRALIVSTSLIFSTHCAFAQTDMPDLSDIVTIDLIKGWTLPDQTRMAAIRVTLAEGWKTYWRVAGETGLPPVFDWQASTNLDHVDYKWPRPEIIVQDGLQILGYSHQLILPVLLTAVDPDAAIGASLALDLGVCREVCVPVHVDLAASFDRAEGPERLLIDMALADQPKPAAEAGLTRAQCRLADMDGGFHLSARIDMPALAGKYELVTLETGRADIWASAARTRRQGNMLLAELDLMNYTGQPVTLDQTAFRLTVIGQNNAVDIPGCSTFE